MYLKVPKRKPKLLKDTNTESKPLPPPKKFATFSVKDSRSIETAYQKFIENEEDEGRTSHHPIDLTNEDSPRQKANSSLDEAQTSESRLRTVKVPVNEDFLFDVDIERRELAPVYWLGPIYEVRRGTWFYQEGSSLRPCDENLATQLEEGYLKVKPFRYPKAPEKQTHKVGSSKPSDEAKASATAASGDGNAKNVTPKSSVENLEDTNKSAGEQAGNRTKDVAIAHQPQTYRLFGTYMNSVVTYQDDSVAWLASDGLMSRVSTTVYQRFAGSGYMSGVKLVRGYSEGGKSQATDVKVDRPSTPNPATAGESNSSELQLDERQQKLLKRRSAPPALSRPDITNKSIGGQKPKVLESKEVLIESKLSTLISDTSNPEEEEAVGRRDEKEIQDDYQDLSGEDQSREIEHLVLVTHGIGQRLGMR
jgi:hypothetical protein